MSKVTQVDFVPREMVSYSKETQTPTEAATTHTEQKAGETHTDTERMLSQSYTYVVIHTIVIHMYVFSKTRKRTKRLLLHHQLRTPMRRRMSRENSRRRVRTEMHHRQTHREASGWH